MKALLPVTIALLTLAATAVEHQINIESPKGGEYYVINREHLIILDDKTRAKQLSIELSRDGGLTWKEIGEIDNLAKKKKSRQSRKAVQDPKNWPNILAWNVTGPPTDNAYIRVTSLDPRKPGQSISQSFVIQDGSEGVSDPTDLFVMRSGDTMTGRLNLAADPIQSMEAATKNYVDKMIQDCAKKSDIPEGQDLSDYAKKSDLSDYAKKSDIPNTDDFMRKSDYDPDNDGKVERAKLADCCKCCEGGHGNNGLVISAEDSLPGYTKVGTIFSHSWIKLADMPTGRAAFGIAQYNGKIYVIGGYNGSGYLNNNEVYDIASNTWSVMEPMPTARNTLSAFEHNGKIHCIGGSNGNALTTHEIYDPATNTWATGVSMTMGRASMAMAKMGNKVYFIGGSNANSVYYSKNEVLDLGTNTWTTKASAPMARSNGGTSVMGSRIYVIGGQQGASGINNNYIYDTSSNTWSSGAAMPTARNGVICAQIDSKIYAIGGSETFYTRNECYDPITNSWSDCMSMPTGRTNPGGVSVGERVYVVGGRNHVFHVTLEVFQAKLNVFMKTQ